MSLLARRTIASFAAAATLILTGAVVPAAAAPPSPVNYVNLGDSYSAGWGAYAPSAAPNPNYPAGTPCFVGGRPDNVTVFSALASVSLTGDYACAGATVATAPGVCVPAIAQQAAKAAADGRLGASTGLVTFTAGGNDVHFGDIIAACATDLSPDAHLCQGAVDQGPPSRGPST